MPPWILHAVSHRFEYHIALLQGVIGATELARCAAAPRTIALLPERLVLGASLLQIGRQSGRYRDKSYESKTHVILPYRCALPPIMLPSDHERNAVGLNAT